MKMNSVNAKLLLLRNMRERVNIFKRMVVVAQQIFIHTGVLSLGSVSRDGSGDERTYP